MKRKLSVALLFCMLSSAVHAQRMQQLFDSSWKFFKGDVTDGSRPDTDDADWRIVELPHDWSIEDLPNQSDSVIGPFAKASIGRTATGYTVGGTGWYRKHFISDGTKGKKTTIYFDGVYMNSDVWINGHHLGNHPYGYTAFYYDLSPIHEGRRKHNSRQGS
jgi:beta-galactosidase